MRPSSITLASCSFPLSLHHYDIYPATIKAPVWLFKPLSHNQFPTLKQLLVGWRWLLETLFSLHGCGHPISPLISAAWCQISMYYVPAVPLSYSGLQMFSYECTTTNTRLPQRRTNCNIWLKSKEGTDKICEKLHLVRLQNELWCTWLELFKQTGLDPTRVQEELWVADT